VSLSRIAVSSASLITRIVHRSMFGRHFSNPHKAANMCPSSMVTRVGSTTLSLHLVPGTLTHVSDQPLRTVGPNRFRDPGRHSETQRLRCRCVRWARRDVYPGTRYASVSLVGAIDFRTTLNVYKALAVIQKEKRLNFTRGRTLHVTSAFPTRTA
jgi:hypothetical protein